MYVDRDGKEWSSKEKADKFAKLMSDLANFDIELECYSDDTGDYSVDDDISLTMLKELRKNRLIWDEDKLMSEAQATLAAYNNVVDKVGREKFVFNEDGSMSEYIWIKNNEKEK